MFRMLKENPLLLPVGSSRMIFCMLSTLLPIYLLKKDISPFSVGVILSIYGYAALAVSLTASLFIERYKKHKLLAYSLLGMGLACAGYLLSSSNLIYLGSLQLIFGISFGIFRPTSNTMVCALSKKDKVASSIGRHNVAYILGGSVGPLLAMYIYESYTITVVWLFAAVFMFCMACYVWRQTYIKTASRDARKRIIQLKTINSLLFGRQLFKPLAFIMLDVLILRMWITFLPLYMHSFMNTAMVTIGLLISVESFAYMLAQTYWGHFCDRKGYGYALFIGFGSSLVLPCIPLISSTILLATVFVLHGLLNAAAYPAYMKLAFELSGKEARGTAMALMSSSAHVGHILGPLIGSIIYAASASYAFIFYSMPMIIGSALLVLHQSYDRKRRESICLDM